MTLDPKFFDAVATYGTPDYYALLFSPRESREQLRVVLAIDAILSQLSTQPLDPQVRQAKLGWWAAELKRLADGTPIHPVAMALHEILSRQQISVTPLLESFSAIVREASDKLPTTPTELLDHAKSRTAFLCLMSGILAGTNKNSEHVTRPFSELGQARFVAVNLYLDHTHQAQHDNTADHEKTLQALATGQRKSLVTALSTLSGDDCEQFIPLLVMASMVYARLEDIAAGKRPSKPLHTANLFRAWRSARRASQGRLPVEFTRL